MSNRVTVAPEFTSEAIRLSPVRVTPEAAERIAYLARQRRLLETDLIREAIQAYLDRYENE